MTTNALAIVPQNALNAKIDAKVAKVNERIAKQQSDRQLLIELLKSPIVELIAGFVVVEMLQRTPSGRPIIGSVQGTLLETAIVGSVTAQQLSAFLPVMAQSQSDMIKAIAPLLPMLIK